MPDGAAWTRQRLSLAGAGLVLLLSLCAHWSADLAWLHRNAALASAGPAVPAPATSNSARLSVPDPHGEAVITPGSWPAPPLSWLAATLELGVRAWLRKPAPLLHPPAVTLQ
jgi:hypothetical protein